MDNIKEQIFVFGANKAGRHGAGSAKEAVMNWGAVYGQGEGRQGYSYGIPTKDEKLKVLPLDEIQTSVNYFIQYANEHPELEFILCKIGCGLAGYREEQIAPMFKNSPNNVIKPKGW